MKIGIIGSNGFIGSNVYNNLKKNSFYKVIKFSSYKKLKKDWIKKVSDEIKIFKPNIIINCAAYQDLNENKKSIKYHLNSNLFSNIFFLNQATNYSSFKGYINFGTKWEFDKKGNFQPLNFYAATKHACDNYLQYLLKIGHFLHHLPFFLYFLQHFVFIYKNLIILLLRININKLILETKNPTISGAYTFNIQETTLSFH